MSLEPWRRNLVAVTGATFLGFASFTLVMPFLPLYFRQLGLTDMASIAMWSGLSLGITPAMTAVLAPTWGLLADRFGLKLMVTRSLVSCIVVMLAMANVTAPWHVFALRALQGLFAGYGGLVLTMAADAAPPQKVASAIGAVQTAQRLGPALGPAIGGALAGWVGLRQSFYVAALVYALGVLLLWVGYHQARPHAAHEREPVARGSLSLRGMLTLDNCALLLVAVFVLQFAERTFGPTLPLYVAEMVGNERSLAVAGALFSLMAAAGAVGNMSAGWWLQRAASRQVIVAALALASVGSDRVSRRSRPDGHDGRGGRVRRWRRAVEHRDLRGGGSRHPFVGARARVRLPDERLAGRHVDQPDGIGPGRRDEPAGGVRGRVAHARWPGARRVATDARRHGQGHVRRAGDRGRVAPVSMVRAGPAVTASCGLRPGGHRWSPRQWHRHAARWVAGTSSAAAAV